MTYNGIGYLARCHIEQAIINLEFAKKGWTKAATLSPQGKKGQDLYNMRAAITRIEEAIKEVENENNNN